MEAKFFSYQIPGLELKPVNKNLKLSESFDKKELLNGLKELLKDQDYKIDNTSLDYKITDGIVTITGMAVKEDEPKSIGFMSGK